MGSIVNKSTTSNPIIDAESSVNETVFEPANESPETEQPMERGCNESELINKLEQDGYDKLKKLNRGETLPANATNKDFGDALINIMKSGADEFKEKTGRNMTYSEMRHAYG